MTNTTRRALMRAMNDALTAAVDAQMYGDTPVRTRVLTQAHTAAYRRLYRVTRTTPKAVCEWCDELHPVDELAPLTDEGVAEWFEEHQGWDRSLQQCSHCRERWYYAAGYSAAWHGEE